MKFYDLKKEEGELLVKKINKEILIDIQQNQHTHLILYFSDEDTYIHKTSYLAIGKIWKKLHSSKKRDFKYID